MKPNETWSGILTILVSTLGFSVYPIFGKAAFAGGASLATVLFVRFLIAAIGFWFGVLREEGIPRISRKSILQLWLLGGVAYSGQAALYLASIRLIPASLAVLLLYIYPILVTVLAAASGEERLTGLKIGGLAASSVGLILILGIRIQGINFWGVLFGVGAAAVYALYILVSNHVLKSVRPLVGSAFISSAGAMTYGVVALSQGLTLHLTGSTWLAIVGIAVVSTNIAILTFFIGLRKVGPTTASILSTMEPVLTVILAVLILGEKLNVSQGMGALCVIIGALVAAWPQKPSYPLSQTLNTPDES